MFKKKKETHKPVRLAKVEEKPKRQLKYNFNDYVFTFIIVMGLLLFLSLFVLSLYTIIPPTYGFYWW